MSAIIFNGRAEAKARKEELKKRVMSLGITPKLVSFYLPCDEGSCLYTKIKRNAAIEVGIEFEDIEINDGERGLKSAITSGASNKVLAGGEVLITQVVQKVAQLNSDPSVHGILVQKPSGVNNFPEEDWDAMVSAIDPQKDVDGLTGKNPKFLPATVKAVLLVLESSRALNQGYNIVVVGDTDILGLPLVKYLEGAGEKVRVVNKFTQDLSVMMKNADVLVSATGVTDLISKDMVKEGAVVIDVGEPKGDVQEDVREVASFLSPVPGGVGPLTVVSLLENTVEAASLRHFE